MFHDIPNDVYRAQASPTPIVSAVAASSSASRNLIGRDAPLPAPRG